MYSFDETNYGLTCKRLVRRLQQVAAGCMSLACELRRGLGARSELYHRCPGFRNLRTGELRRNLAWAFFWPPLLSCCLICSPALCHANSLSSPSLRRVTLTHAEAIGICSSAASECLDGSWCQARALLRQGNPQRCEYGFDLFFPFPSRHALFVERYLMDSEHYLNLMQDHLGPGPSLRFLRFLRFVQPQNLWRPGFDRMLLRSAGQEILLASAIRTRLSLP